MAQAETARIGYVLKMYPRYSETFIVTEILAHEAAGADIEIFSLRSPIDTHFQNAIARVRAPVHYVPGDEHLKGADLWAALEEAGELLPGLWPALAEARGELARDVYQAAHLAREVRARGIGHLHAHFASTATSVARLAARFAGVPFTFTAHAKDIFHESVQPHDLRRKLGEARSVVTVSDFNVQYLQQGFGPAAAGVQRIYNGLDLACFPFRSPEHRARRIVAVGRLVEKKGFGHLLEACALLAGTDPELRCDIVGAGPLEGELRAQAERLGLGGRVAFLGPRPQSVLGDLVQSAAVFVAPCVDATDGDRDGLPTVLLEAMALGTPCVSTDVTGIPEVVRDRETGLLVPQQNPAALAGAVQELLRDPGLGVRLAARARALIEEEFDIHHNAARIRALFRSARVSAQAA